MAILETIWENIGTAGMITADIAKRTAESLRLRDQIRRDKKEIRKLTYEIGQTYLRLHADDYEDVYKEFVDGIAAARADIEEKMGQLAELKEKLERAEEEEEALEEEWDDFFEDMTEEIKETAPEVLPEPAPEPAAEPEAAEVPAAEESAEEVPAEEEPAAEA